MIIEIKIPNLQRFVSALGKAPTIVTKHINSAIEKSIYEVKQKSIYLTPVDTGKLARESNWRSDFRDMYGELEPMATNPYGQKYAYWVHEGHQSYYGTPFLRAGVETAMPTVRSIFGRSLNDALNEIAQQSK